MDNHPIETIMKTTLEQINQMIDVNTIVGDAFETTDGTTVIPISKVSFGFVTGGGEYTSMPKKGSAQNEEDNKGKFPFIGGTGAGVSLNPVAFLVARGDWISVLPAQHSSPIDRLVEMIPQAAAEIKNYIKCKQNPDGSSTVDGNLPQQDKPDF